MEVRCKYRDLEWGETRPGWMWDVNLGGLGGIQTEPGWMWNENLWPWMKVRWYMDGNEIIFFWPGLRWDRKRMPMRCKFWNLAGFETVSVWSWDATWWDTILWTCMKVKWYMDVGEIIKFGYGFSGTGASLMHILIPGWLSVRTWIYSIMQ